jgi:homogentisate 1,2-dioxygenase
VWYYKLRPSAVEGQYKKSNFPYKILSGYLQKEGLDYHPNQLRWRPIPDVEGSVNFVQGLVSLMGAGEPSLKQGISIYVYSANASMDKSAFVNSDGDLLIVPHLGTIKVKTLNGLLTVKPREILVVPRGVKFSVDIDGPIKGWAC